MIRRTAGRTTWRMLTSSNVCKRLTSSTSPISTQLLNASTIEESEAKGNRPISPHSNSNPGTSARKSNSAKSGKKLLVTEALRSFQSKESSVKIEDLLQSAKTVEDILSASEFHNFSQYHALQVLSVLAEWTTSKKIKMQDFESDPRFVNLCKLIGPKQNQNMDGDSDYGDLGVVLGVSGDEQAAKMVTGISFSQKIRVLSTLALKKRRSFHLLKALSANLCQSSEKLDIKQAADVLYAMSVLNFPDKALLNKVVSDICSCLHKNERPAVVGSILTSTGILKYRNTELLNALAQWVEVNIAHCREQDLISLFLTLASVNYRPPNANKLFKIILPTFNEKTLKPIVWLDVVWSLCVLNAVETSHLESVLVPEFVERLTHTGYVTNIPAPTRLKLLNINVVAEKIVKNYKGPLLEDISNLKFPLQRSRQKQILVDSVIDSLTNLLPTSTYLRTNIDTGYGFLIDGECVVDDKCNPLPVDDSASKSVARRKRVAVFVCDYHDMCRECEELSGPAALQVQILEHLGYTVMTVTYLEFKPTEKLVSRVKYLEQKLKKLASKSQ